MIRIHQDAAINGMPRPSRQERAYLAGRYGGMRGFASIAARLRDEHAPHRTRTFLVETTAFFERPARRN